MKLLPITLFVSILLRDSAFADLFVQNVDSQHEEQPSNFHFSDGPSWYYDGKMSWYDSWNEGISLDMSTYKGYTTTDDVYLRSPAIADGQEAWMSWTVKGYTAFRFNYLLCSEENSDYMIVMVDDNEVFRLSGSHWGKSRTLSLPDVSEHTIKWIYKKDNNGKKFFNDSAYIHFEGIESILEYWNKDNGRWSQDESHQWQQHSYMTAVNSRGLNVPFMQSPYLNDGESSWMSYTVAGQSVFCFSYGISSEQDSDYLVVLVDDEEIARFSGEVWNETYQIDLPDMFVHTIKWTYQKDSNGSSSGNDCAYIWFEGIEAIETDGYSMNLVYPWIKDTATASGGWWGNTPLKSGAIPDGESTSFSVTCKQSEYVYFFWKTSSEGGHDKLQCFKNDELVYELSGETDWEQRNVYVNAGDVLTWQYEKDDNGISVGQDCGWVDYYGISDFESIMDLFPDDENAEVTVTKNIALDLNTGRAAQQSILDASDGVAFTSGVERLCWHVDDQTAYGGSRSLKSGSVTNGASSYMRATVIGKGSVTFHWKVSSAANVGVLSYAVDDETKSAISGEQGWAEVVVDLPTDERHEITWTYTKNGSDASGSDCGWVDGIVWYAPEGYDDPDEPIVPASVSQFITLDLRPLPRAAAPTEKIVFDSSWGDASQVSISVNGTEVTNGVSGVYVWDSTSLPYGTNEIRLVAGPLSYAANLITFGESLWNNDYPSFMELYGDYVTNVLSKAEGRMVIDARKSQPLMLNSGDQLNIPDGIEIIIPAMYVNGVRVSDATYDKDSGLLSGIVTGNGSITVMRQGMCIFF